LRAIGPSWAAPTITVLAMIRSEAVLENAGVMQVQFCHIFLYVIEITKFIWLR
jgi:hypothetical protein